MTTYSRRIPLLTVKHPRKINRFDGVNGNSALKGFATTTAHQGTINPVSENAISPVGNAIAGTVNTLDLVSRATSSTWNDNRTLLQKMTGAPKPNGMTNADKWITGLNTANYLNQVGLGVYKGFMSEEGGDNENTTETSDTTSTDVLNAKAGGGKIETYSNAASDALNIAANAFQQAQPTVTPEEYNSALRATTDVPKLLTDYDTLEQQMGVSQDMRHISKRDIRKNSYFQDVMNAISAGNAGAVAGFGLGSLGGSGSIGSSAYGGSLVEPNKYALGGPWGAAIGGVVGTGTSIAGTMIGRHKARQMAKKLNTAIDQYNDRQMLGFAESADQIAENQLQDAERDYYALGGGIHINPENKGKFTEAAKRAGMSVQEYARHILANKDKYSPTLVKRANFARNASKWHDFGGELNTKGANFTNGLLEINEGSSHELNPLEGVPMGFDKQGTPNVVEEGETIYDIPGTGPYVFSRRGKEIPVPKEIREKYHLGNKKNLSFAEASKKLAKESEERPNDPISLNAMDIFMAELRDAQEQVKAEKKAKEQEEILGLMDAAGISPQDLAMAQQQQAAQQQGMQIISPEEQVGLQQMAMQQPNMSAYGGETNKEEVIDMRKFPPRPYGMTYEDWLRKMIYVHPYYREYNAGSLPEITVTPNKNTTIKKVINQPNTTKVYIPEIVKPYKMTTHGTIQLRRNSFLNEDIYGNPGPVEYSKGGYIDDEWYPNLIDEVVVYPEYQKDKVKDVLLKASGLPTTEDLLLNILTPRHKRDKEKNEKALGGRVNRFDYGSDIEKAFAKSLEGKSYNKANDPTKIPSASAEDDNAVEIQATPEYQNFWKWIYNSASDSSNPNYNSAIGILKQITADDKSEYTNGVNRATYAKGMLFDEQGNLKSNWADYVYGSGFKGDFDNYQWSGENLSGAIRDNREGWFHQYVPITTQNRYYEDLGNNNRAPISDFDPNNPGVFTVGDKSFAQSNTPVLDKDGNLVLYNDYLLTVNPKNNDEFVSEDDTVFGNNTSQEENPNRVAQLSGLLKDESPVMFPLYANGAMVLTDALGLTNKPDYTEVGMVADAARPNWMPVSFNPIGNYMTYNPFDVNYVANVQRASDAANRRALLNNAGQIRGLGAASLLAQRQNEVKGLGDIYKASYEYNDAKDEKAHEFNKDTDKYNSTGIYNALKANQDAYATALQRHLSGIEKAAELRQQERQAVDAAKSQNLSNFVEGLGNLGEDNRAWNQFVIAAALGAFGNPNWDTFESLVSAINNGKKTSSTSTKKKMDKSTKTKTETRAKTKRNHDKEKEKKGSFLKRIANSLFKSRAYRYNYDRDTGNTNGEE